MIILKAILMVMGLLAIMWLAHVFYLLWDMNR